VNEGHFCAFGDVEFGAEGGGREECDEGHAVHVVGDRFTAIHHTSA
jgi:hypothetical protein